MLNHCRFHKEARMREDRISMRWHCALVAAVLLCCGTILIARHQTQSPQNPPAQKQGQTSGQVLGPGGEVWGFTNLAEIPGTPWRIHDANRPQPRLVTPGEVPGEPPAD